jgi:hypothetical protein
MKKKVIKVEYRKDSESFPDWLKYEITILKQDGTIDKIPAYGKDLQDALSRIVHDERVDKIHNKTSSIPWWIWALVYFIYMSFISIWSISYNKPSILIFGLIGTLAFIFILNKFLKKRNKDINYS